MSEAIQELVDRLTAYNLAYRSGSPIISDAEYDETVEALRDLDPNHPFLARVEPEKFEGRKKVRHPSPMLSIEKAYTKDQLGRFIHRVEKAAAEIGIDKVWFKVTPKLDGLAGRDDGRVFASRGNGMEGYEISTAFDKGVIPIGGRGQGIGEIVMVKSYFDDQMAEFFEHPRNMVVGIVTSDTLNENAKKALENKKVHFVPYTGMAGWEGSGQSLLENTEGITTDILNTIDYPVDGVVAEVTDDAVKAHMGATSHHYRWQIAIKTRGETAETVVDNIKWQVGRTGNITPVLEVAPVFLSGATIKRVTAHHAGNIKALGIGKGARIKIIRSGEVIPKLEAVIETGEDATVPAHCPSCGAPLEWQNDFLKCLRYGCRAQIEQRIAHWFKILGNADWFGIKTIQKLVENRYDTLEKIYGMGVDDFLSLSFGPVQSKNLFDAIAVSRTQPVEDWRFIAAFGISDLGTGDSRKLLSHIPLDRLLETDQQEILAIKGFGEKTSRSIEKGLTRIRKTIEHMLALGFNIEKTKLLSHSQPLENPVAGRGIVFTGKMAKGSRKKMQDQARELGAKVQTAVSGVTDYLVCGENVGRVKIKKAQQLGVNILTEQEYLELIETG